ncbi:DJ-1/PfpI family protein [Polycladidibacter hongkongensis]|uniref:DJ-1/PfpI family protein n=1 Tax=Polycladidibacter hongkongensis TaxID=1647556 RepID=UPI00082A1813|nr:DJ-1/PfpI family protein [Pseudovibrio hongkongensis]
MSYEEPTYSGGYHEEARVISALIYPGFDMLDLFGPLEMFTMLPFKYKVHLVAQTMQPVPSKQGAVVLPDMTLEEDDRPQMLLVPGGQGAGAAVESSAILQWISRASLNAETVMSVCTGAALLARAGVLDGLSATSNKMALNWVETQGPKVRWKAKGRWVQDSKFYTSSGIAAGIDMALAVIAEQQGKEVAYETALYAEYSWNDDPTNDPFTKKESGLSTLVGGNQFL